MIPNQRTVVYCIPKLVCTTVKLYIPCKDLQREEKWVCLVQCSKFLTGFKSFVRFLSCSCGMILDVHLGCWNLATLPTSFIFMPFRLHICNATWINCGAWLSLLSLLFSAFCPTITVLQSLSLILLIEVMSALTNVLIEVIKIVKLIWWIYKGHKMKWVYNAPIIRSFIHLH